MKRKVHFIILYLYLLSLHKNTLLSSFNISNVVAFRSKIYEKKKTHDSIKFANATETTQTKKKFCHK